MRPFIVFAYCSIAAVATAVCAVTADERSDEYDDGYQNHGRDQVVRQASTTTTAVRRNDMSFLNKCTDSSTGKKYKIGVTWYPEGCGRRTCIYTSDHSLPVTRTETCRCKECPAGMECSTVRRAVSNEFQYPHCCPLTTCVPKIGRNFWEHFKKKNWKLWR